MPVPMVLANHLSVRKYTSETAETTTTYDGVKFRTMNLHPESYLDFDGTTADAA